MILLLIVIATVSLLFLMLYGVSILTRNSALEREYKKEVAQNERLWDTIRAARTQALGYSDTSPEAATIVDTITNRLSYIRDWQDQIEGK